LTVCKLLEIVKLGDDELLARFLADHSVVNIEALRPPQLVVVLEAARGSVIADLEAFKADTGLEDGSVTLKALLLRLLKK